MLKCFSRSLRGLAVFLLALLVAVPYGAWVSVSTARAAAPSADVLLEVDNGGVAEITSLAQKVEFTVRVRPSVDVAAGGKLVVSLPQEFTSAPPDFNASQAAWMQSSPSLNAQTNEIEFEVGALAAGGIYAYTFRASANGFAVSASTFVVGALLEGVYGGISFSNEAESAPIKYNISGNTGRPVQAGDYTLKDWTVTTRGAGEELVLDQMPVNNSATVSFNNLRLETDLSLPAGSTAEQMPRTAFWNFFHYYHSEAYGSSRLVRSIDEPTRVANDSGSRTIPQGASIPLIRTQILLPNDSSGKTFEFSYRLQDVAKDGKVTTIAESKVKIVVKPVSAYDFVDVMQSKVIPEEVSPGEEFSYGYRATYRFNEYFRDMRDVFPVPAGTTPKLVMSANIENLQGVRYSYDGINYHDANRVNSFSWDFQGATAPITHIELSRGDGKYVWSSGYHMITLQVNQGVQASTLNLGIEQTSWDDPITKQRETQSGSPLIRQQTVTVNPAKSISESLRTSISTHYGNSYFFNKNYFNGGHIDSIFHTTTDTSLKNPYQFIVVPRGVKLSPLGKMGYNPQFIAGKSGIVVESRPHHAFSNFDTSVVNNDFAPETVGSVDLSNGSTMYYWKHDKNTLQKGSNGSNTEMFVDSILSLNGLLAGEHKVLFGTGAATDGYTLSQSQTPFTLGNRTSNAALFGAYAADQGQINQALDSIGITSTSIATNEQSFTISGDDAIQVESVIQGSEDEQPVAGSGTATSRIGTTANYEVQITNKGAKEYDNFSFINFAPKKGDEQVISGNPRNSDYALQYADAKPVLTLNGEPVNHNLYTSTSNHPEKFDSQGNTVQGDPWTPSTSVPQQSTALKIELDPSIKFRPGDTLSLKYQAVVPANTPRTGGTANNTIAYRLERQGFKAGLEASAGKVQVPPVTTDYELTGTMKQAGHEGVNGGVKLELWKQNTTGKFENTGQESTPQTVTGTPGIFTFQGLENEAVYKIKPVVTNNNFRLHQTELDSDGFLKYAHSASSAAANTPQNDTATKTLDGSSEFYLRDSGANVIKWVKDLTLTVDVATPFSGKVIFVTNEDIGATPAGATVPPGYAEEYTQNWRATVSHIDGSHPAGNQLSNHDGEWVVTDQTFHASTTEYGVKLTRPQTAHADIKIAATGQNPSYNTTTGMYNLGASLTPGTGASGINIKITDTGNPVWKQQATLAKTKNPNSVTFEATDAATKIVDYAYSYQRGTETPVTGHIASSGKQQVSLSGLEDGAYKFSVTGMDVAGNLTPVSTATFTVDKTAPVVTLATNPVTHTKGASHPANSDQWIAAFKATASENNVTWNVNTANVNENRIGDYQVTFTATDDHGNQSQPVTGTYRVRYVTDPQVTTTVQQQNWEMGGTPLTDQQLKELYGAAVTVAAGSDATQATIAVNKTGVNWNTLNNTSGYPVTFTATDAEGNTSQTRTVYLRVTDTIPPTVTVTNTTVHWHKGDSKPSTDAQWVALFGVTATDTGSGLAGNPTIQPVTVNYNQQGSYAITFTATDKAGNKGQATARFYVDYDGEPTITFDRNTIVVEYGTTENFPLEKLVNLYGAKPVSGGTAETKIVKVEGLPTNFNTETEHTLTFTARDSFNTETTATVKLRVADRTAPTVQLGKKTLVMPAKDPSFDIADWIDALQATATDIGVGVNTASWQLTGDTVDWGSAGTYTVKLTVADSAQTPNRSTPVTAKIIVAAAPTTQNLDIKLSEDGSTTVNSHAKAQADTAHRASLAPLETSMISTPAHGKITAVTTGGFTYTPNPGHIGDDQITVQVTDNLGQSTPQKIVLHTIAKVKTTGQLQTETPVAGTHTFTKTDIAAVTTAGSKTKLVKVTTPEHGKTKLTGQGEIIYETDGTAWTGETKFEATIQDKFGNKAQIPVTIKINPVKTFKINVAEGIAGETSVQVAMLGLAANTKHTIKFRSTPQTVATFTSNATGEANATFKIPATAAAGLHHVTLNSAQNHELARTPITVKHKPATGGIPSTGTTSLTPLGIVALLIIAAASLTIANSRKRKA